MKPINKLLSVLIAAAALLLAVPASAGELGPQIPKPLKGEKCVEDTSDMRRNHMDYLKKHRDEALREGIRTEKYSLKECLDCHVSPTASANEEHFCKTCHAYTGVTLDCFECHNTRPQPSSSSLPRANAINSPESEALLKTFASVSTNK